MKRSSLAALVFSFATCAFASDSPTPVRLSLQLVKNGTQTWSWDASAVEGERAPMSRLTTTTYLAEYSLDSKGGPVMRSETLTTGIEALVVPTQVDADGATIGVTLYHRELQGMKTTNVKGYSLVSPSIGKHEMSVQVRLRPGESVELPGANGTDKYVLVIRRL
jgi:hypothetical protein